MKIRNNIDLMATPTKGSHVANVDYVDGKMKTITWAEYEALTEEEKNNGTLYDIPDMPTNAATKENSFMDEYGFVYNFKPSSDFKNLVISPNGHSVHKIEITGDNVTISYYPKDNTLPMLIDYGDGTVETLSASINHVYNQGTYYVRATNMYMVLRNSDLTNVLDIQVGVITDCKKLFYQYKGSTLDVSNLDTSKATDMSHMFYGCNNLTTLDVSNFNASNVTTMNSMFSSCSGLTSLDVSNWDTSNVTDMNSMFYTCSNLTNLDVSNLDTSKVTNMNYMFSNCKALTTLDVSSFDTSNVTTMSNMFYSCSKLTTLDLSSFDTSNVTTMVNMFQDCDMLTALDLSSFDTSNVTTMFYMFLGCDVLEVLDLSSFDTSSVTNMAGMFFICEKLKTLKLGNKFITSNVTSYNVMFNRTALTKIQIPADFPAESKTFLEARLTDAGILANVTFETY